MKIALLTFHDGPLRAIGELTLPNKRAYAERHGYELIVPEVSLSGDRPSAWTKDASVLAALETHDAVFWADADSIITDMERAVESFLADESELVFGAVDNLMNNGGFIIRSTPGAKDFMRAAWQLPQSDERFAQFIAPEATKWSQACMIETLLRDLTCLRFKNVGDELCSHYWHSGRRFLFHPFGTRLDRRHEYLQERLFPDHSYTEFGEDVFIAELFKDQRGRIMEFSGPDCRRGIARKLVRLGWCSCMNGEHDALSQAFGGFGSFDIVGEVPPQLRFHVVSVQRDGVDLQQVSLAAKHARVMACRSGEQSDYAISLGFSPEMITDNMVVLLKA